MNYLEWKFNNPQFVVDLATELHQKSIQNGAWSGHRRFAYDLVSVFKPRITVELGTHYGTSFFSFCQAIKDSQIPAFCYAIDTWKGDPHAGYYDEDVYQAVEAVNNREFPNIGKLLRMEFDKALSEFENNSINILHIDGYHTYEAVHHDYTTWYPKLCENSIVLFHDTAVHNGDFGVNRFWEELSDLPHLEFSHCNGLGILFPKGVPDLFQGVLKQKDTIVQYYQNNQV